MATLDPNANLAAATTYTATLKGGSGGVKDLAGNPLAADVTWSFTTAAAPPADTTPPTVTATSPANNATGVAVGNNITATFSEAIDPATLTTTTFLLGRRGRRPGQLQRHDRVATLDPNANLAAATTYTATLKGGNGGVKDLAGNPLAADVTWSFTTDPAAPPPPITAGTYNLWSGSATPTAASDPDPNSVELGVKFGSDVAGWITGIRFYKGPGNTGTHIGHLWTSNGTRLASATFTNETASGWQQVSFATPVAIAANTTYVASYSRAGGALRG